MALIFVLRLLPNFLKLTKEYMKFQLIIMGELMNKVRKYIFQMALEQFMHYLNTIFFVKL